MLLNRIICVRTGDKFSQWYEDNLKYQIDKYSCLQYDEFVVIRDDEYEGVFNKLQMFDRYRDGQNILSQHPAARVYTQDNKGQLK